MSLLNLFDIKRNASAPGAADALLQQTRTYILRVLRHDNSVLLTGLNIGKLQNIATLYIMNVSIETVIS